MNTAAIVQQPAGRDEVTVKVDGVERLGSVIQLVDDQREHSVELRLGVPGTNAQT